MERNLFGRLLAFWQAAAPTMGLGGGIGFWRRKTGIATQQDAAGRQRNAAAAEAADVAKSAKEVEQAYFWQERAKTATEMTDGGWILQRMAENVPAIGAAQALVRGASDAEDMAEKPKKMQMATLTRAATGKRTAPEEEDARKKGERRLFAGAFWDAGAEGAQEAESMEKRRLFREEVPLLSEQGRMALPNGEKAAEKRNAAPVLQEIAQKELKREEKPAEMAREMDVDALMRQFAQRLQEAREGASRRRYH